MGDFTPDRLDSRSLQTLWEWKNRVLLEEYVLHLLCSNSSFGGFWSRVRLGRSLPRKSEKSVKIGKNQPSKGLQITAGVRIPVGFARLRVGAARAFRARLPVLVLDGTFFSWDLLLGTFFDFSLRVPRRKRRFLDKCYYSSGETATF